MKPARFSSIALRSGWLAGALLLVACDKQAPLAVPPPRVVAVANAELRDVPFYLDEIGSCTAWETVTIQPQVAGMLVGIHFKDGAEVKKGDQLFSIDPRPYQAALDQAKATLEQDRAKAVFADSQLARNEELRTTKVVSPQDYDNAQSAARAAKAVVQADEAAVAAAQLNREFCDIRSPIDGRTSKRMVDMGNIVTGASQLLLIQRQDPMYVDFTVPEGILPQIRRFKEAGTLKVAASFADDPQKSREGAFDFMDSGVQPNSGTVRMRASLDNKDRLFWPGQFVNVRLLLDTVKNAVLVPSEAVQIGQKGPFVFLVKADSTVDLRPVKQGQRQGEDVVVTEGLKPGETVVVTGQVALAPGAKVAPTPMAKP